MDHGRFRIRLLALPKAPKGPNASFDAISAEQHFRPNRASPSQVKARYEDIQDYLAKEGTKSDSGFLHARHMSRICFIIHMSG